MKRAVLVLVGALALFGCGGGGGGNGGGSSPARVAFVDASPDADSNGLDFALNGNVKAASVAIDAAPTFQSVDAGDYDVAIRKAGAVDDLVNEARTFAKDTDTVIVAGGLLAPPNDDQVPPAPQSAKNVQLFTTTVDRTSLTGNRARIIVLNAFIPTAEPPIVAVDLRNPDDPLNTSLSVTNLAYGAFSSQDVNSGNLSYQVRPTGTDDVFVPTKTIPLDAGGVYLVVITGTQGGAGTQLPSIRVFSITDIRK